MQYHGFWSTVFLDVDNYRNTSMLVPTTACWHGIPQIGIHSTFYVHLFGEISGSASTVMKIVGECTNNLSI